MMSISRHLRFLVHLIYHVQVTLTFPLDTLGRFIEQEWVLPEGYSLRSPSGKNNLKEWADLLMSDGHFGEWTPEKIEIEISAQMIAPDAASLLFFNETLVGCFCTSVSQRPGIGLGMWFIITPPHRGKNLSFPLCFRTLAYFTRENYSKVLLTTDAFRLPALRFYLSNGAKPVYSSLLSVLQWWKIKRELKRFKRTEEKSESNTPFPPQGDSSGYSTHNPLSNSQGCRNGEGIEICEIRKATDKEWDAVWDACDYATYSYSRKWAEIWQTYTNNFMCPCGRLVGFSDGKSVILPFSVQRRKGLIKHYFLAAEGNFGSWISESALSERHVVLLTEYLTKRVGNLIWRWNPYDGYNIDVSPDEVFSVEHDETYAIDLRKGFEGIYRECSHGHRCSARKAEREGIIIKYAEHEEEWWGYYVAYRDSLERWGDSALSQFTWDLFYDIFQRNSVNIKLWVAIYKNMVISGALCFYAKNMSSAGMHQQLKNTLL